MSSIERFDDGHIEIGTTILPPENKDAVVHDWMKQEGADLDEVAALLKYDHRLRSVDQMDIVDCDRLMRKKMGCRFGRWKNDGTNPDGITLVTERDFTNMEILKSYFRDLCNSTDHYIRWRRKRLTLMMDYATSPMTIAEFQTKDDKLANEMTTNAPNNENVQEAARHVVAEADRRPGQLQDLVSKTATARQALFEAMKDIGSTYLEFKEASDNIAKEVHAFRSSVVTDLAKARSEMADVRKFFLSPEHLTEVERLEKFIALCYEFKRLKDSGFLDAIVDTILRLEEGK